MRMCGRYSLIDYEKIMYTYIHREREREREGERERERLTHRV